jgi:hypothetical protein
MTHKGPTIGEMIEMVARHTGLPEASLRIYARVLREAGLLSTGARGVNAPPMTWLDLSRFLIALLGTGVAARAADAVKDFGEMVVADHPTPLATVQSEDDTRTFEQALADQLQAASTVSPALAGYVFVERSTLGARIHAMNGEFVEFVHPFEIVATADKTDEGDAIYRAWKDKCARYSSKIEISAQLGFQLIHDLSREFAS